MTLIAVLVAWIALVPTLLVFLRLRRGQVPAEAGDMPPIEAPCRAQGRRRPAARPELRTTNQSRPAASDGTSH